MKRSLKTYFLIFIFLIFSTYKTKDNKESSSILFPIKEVLIENNIATNILALTLDLSFLIDKSLLFLNTEKILANISKHDFISTVQLKKKYPRTLKIIITEKFFC